MQTGDVLVHAPFGKDGEVIRRVLDRAGIGARVCRTLGDLYDGIRQSPAMVLIADEALNREGVREFSEHLRAQPAWSDLPVLVMTSGGEADEVSLYRLKLLGPLGNVTLLERPFRKVTLVSAVNTAIRARARQFEIRDHIHDFREVEAALRRANSALEQFAYAAAHDLQEPARTVALYTQLAVRKSKDRLDSDTAQYLAFATESALRMQMLIQDLLRFTRAVDEREALDTYADVGKVIGIVIQNLQTAIAETNGKIVAAEPLPVVPMAEAHLTQILQNLIGNALKYRSHDTPHVRVSVNSGVEQWIFAVEDNGQGIAPEHHDRVFQIFKRLHGQEVPGTGIGLAICQRLVTHYGGRIWLESSPGQGTTFYFSISSGGSKDGPQSSPD